MYGGISHKLSILRKKSPSVDVTPDAVNWPNNTSATLPVDSTTQTITGISAPINLQFTVTNNGLDAYYNKNAGVWLALANNAVISMSAGDTLNFRGDAFFVSGGENVVINVYNTSDGNALLDTLTLTVI